MGKVAILVTVISILATGCTWRQAAGITAFAVASTAVACTGNADAFGTNEMIAGDLAQNLIYDAFDAANGTGQLDR